MYAGYLTAGSKTVAVTNVNDFYTKELCEEARRKVEQEIRGSKYNKSNLINYEQKLICVRTK